MLRFALFISILVLPQTRFAIAQTPTPVPTLLSERSDVNGDNRVDDSDLLILMEDWHKIAGPRIMTIHIPNLPEGARPLRLVQIPAGSFEMGSSETERSRDSDEGPVHTVDFAEDFFLGETEITQAQWEAVMGSLQQQSEIFGIGHNYPVYDVTYDQITGMDGFLDKLNALGQGYFRLPSESEWEYACRAGTQTRFYFGDSLDCSDERSIPSGDDDDDDDDLGSDNCAAGDLPGDRSDYMWYDWNNPRNGFPRGSKEVATLGPNAFDLFDMHGNVREWCLDRYQSSYEGAPTDGSAVPALFGYPIVQRGGDWDSTARHARSANRFDENRSSGHHLSGFRIASAANPLSTPTPSPSPTPFSTPTPNPSLDMVTIDLPDLVDGARPLRLVRIPAGPFLMGTSEDQRYASDNEFPRHEVTLANDFYMSETEITQAQWEAVMGSLPASYQFLDDFGLGDDYPIYYVSWDDIRETGGFLDNLNSLGLGTFRLPSESEWEYACRGSSANPNRYGLFAFGDDTGLNMETCNGSPFLNSFMRWCGNGEMVTEPVGQKVPNDFGLYNMHGNVMEWCEDSEHGSYNGAPIDGSSWSVGGGDRRIVRGGHFDIEPRDCRSASRSSMFRDSPSQAVGLRLVMTVAP